MQRINKKIIVLALILFTVFISDIYSKEIEFKLIDIQQVSRYSEERVAYQQIETKYELYQHSQTDNSIASLLIIRDRKMYLIKDGYDNEKTITHKRRILDRENQLIPDLWNNKIDNKPDYIMVTDRRIELLKNFTQEFVDKNFGQFYINVRDEFINKHVKIFETLMRNRKESGLFVERKPIPKRIYDDSETKYSIRVTAKTIDDRIYYAEDMDGDGVTETFTVSISDGFNWGYKSGANLIMIYNNSQEDIKKLMGNLTKNAYYGTEQEEEVIKKTFPKADEITNMIDYLYKIVEPNIK